MDDLSAWDLIMANRFEEACNRAEEEAATHKSSARLNNKVFALLHLRRHDEVIDLCNYLNEQEKRFSSDSHFRLMGVAFFGSRTGINKP